MTNKTITHYASTRALIICDVDEVVVHFLQPLRVFLNNLGYRLEANNFSLNDNIYSNKTNELAGIPKVQQLLLQFYETTTENLPIVEGAKNSLQNLSNISEIVFLSNIPKQFKFQRRQNLNKHGLSFPFITNNGPKGPVAANLVEQTNRYVFFLDDNPANLKSAQECIENVHLIQFIADEKFFELSPNVKGVKLKSRDWKHVESYISNILHAHPSCN